MIEAELGLLQVQIKRSAGHTVELRQAPLGVAPEAFNAIDMHRAAGELVGAVADAKVFVKAYVHQAVVAAPAIGVDNAGNVGLAPDDGLQSALGGIWHDLCVNTVSTLEQPEHHGFCGQRHGHASRARAWARSTTHQLPTLQQTGSTLRSARPCERACAGKSS